MAKKETNEGVNFNFSISDLDELIAFITSGNKTLRRKHYIKVSNLIKLFNIEEYQNDRAMEVRIYFISKFTEGYMKGLKDIPTIIDYVKGYGEYTEEIEDMVSELQDKDECSDEDIDYIDSKISTLLNYKFIYKVQPLLDKFSISLRSKNYKNLDEFISSYKEAISKLNSKFIENEKINKDSSLDFDSNNIDSLNSVVKHTVDLVNRPNHIISTGIQYLNRMLNGGYESGRFYLYIGIQGGGKSTQLLNACLDLKHCNRDFVTQDPTKKPCVLYVTQENSIPETLQRIYSYYYGTSKDMKGKSPNEIMEKLVQAGFNEGPSLQIKYRPSKTINTEDLNIMMDDLRNEGYETVMLVHDYMKRIRSTESFRESYEELGAVADEFCNIAKARSIPVISATQFNRDALRIVESAIQGNSANILKKVGNSHIGESVRMVDNSDVVIAIAREKHLVTGEPYQAYKLLKFRGEKEESERDKKQISYFAHPLDNGIRLRQDIFSAKSESMLDLADGLSDFDPSSIQRNISSNISGGAKEVSKEKNKLTKLNNVMDYLENL